MGWFDEQIRLRVRNDQDGFSRVLVKMAQTVGGKPLADGADPGEDPLGGAIGGILRYYRAEPGPSGEQGVQESADIQKVLENALRPSGMMHRSVMLKGKWYKESVGALLGEKDGTPVALIPGAFGAYRYLDPETGRHVRVTGRNAGAISRQAVCFYRPFPLKALSVADLIRYIVSCFSQGDILMVAAATLAVTLVGLLVPYINRLIFSSVLPGGDSALLVPIAVFLAGAAVSGTLLSTLTARLTQRINAKLNLSVQAAGMMRVLSLPSGFFKKYNAGSLSTRLSGINHLCNMLVNAVLANGLTSVFSLVYLGQIAGYSPALLLPAVLVLAATTALSILMTFAQLKLSRRQMALSAQRSGLEYGLVSGVQKIRLAGAEKRAFAKWGGLYAQCAGASYNPPAMVRLGSVLETAISLTGLVLVYSFAVASRVDAGTYMAFSAAFGMVSGAVSSLAGMTSTFAGIRPVLENVRPLLNTVPEISREKRAVTRLSGGIELNNVFFRYSEDAPPVLDNLTLKIRPGQYVAIVGRTGCGKSTLMRLMLGLEAPQKGAVYYDGQNLEALDVRSLRRLIGVVMQDGKLFQGSVYSNITISAPWLGMDEAWAAAGMAGLGQDIRQMPMGMHTIISEGGGGISGGQRQRLMIARAVAPKPRILMFDEATSALDNITQKIVSDSLAGLKCTRIVIAHRLSTIRQCDRIIVLDQGRIREDGTYDELIARGGLFGELVKRQRLDAQEGADALP